MVIGDPQSRKYLTKYVLDVEVTPVITEVHIHTDKQGKYKKNHLMFLEDIAIPYDDNMSEMDLRKVKNRQKMAGGFRKASGAKMFCKILSIIET